MQRFLVFWFCILLNFVVFRIIVMFVFSFFRRSGLFMVCGGMCFFNMWFCFWICSVVLRNVFFLLGLYECNVCRQVCNILGWNVFVLGLFLRVKKSLIRFFVDLFFLQLIVVVFIVVIFFCLVLCLSMLICFINLVFLMLVVIVEVKLRIVLRFFG